MAEYLYDQVKVSTLLLTIISNNDNEKAVEWLTKRLQMQQQTNDLPLFIQTFTIIPRFISKKNVMLLREEDSALQKLVTFFFVYGWTLDRLARVWWLLQLPVTDKTVYLETVEQLFTNAEMNEQVALFSALPLLAWPEEWINRTTEGIRSNISIVQDAIMLHNPYPAKYLDEPAWNQLVMKAIFTEKPLHLITGLDQRANAALVAILIDFAQERWTAGRSVDPMQWRLIVNFVNEDQMKEIIRLQHAANIEEQKAAALVCAECKYAPAKEILAQMPALADDIRKGNLSWDTMAVNYTLK